MLSWLRFRRNLSSGRGAVRLERNDSGTPARSQDRDPQQSVTSLRNIASTSAAKKISSARKH
jgi:hypothetical protein